MITRKDLIDKKNTREEYYGDTVTPSVAPIVRRF